MVPLKGYGNIDERNTVLGSPSGEDWKDRGKQGFLLSDAQFAELTEGLDLPYLSGKEQEVRAQLNSIREFVLKDCLQTDQQPRRAEVHKALAETGQQVRGLLDCAANFGYLPNWFADESSLEPEGPLFGVFCKLPEKLYAVAVRARYEAYMCKGGSDQLIAFAEAADGLARSLKWLDFVSQHKVHKQLHQTYDYSVRSMADAVRIAQRLELAVGSALETSKKKGGPDSQDVLKLAVIWLGDLIEHYGGKFTHNPRVKTEYDGRPHTQAGKFAFKFLRMCDSSITETDVSQFMAEAIKFRNRNRRRSKSGRRLPE
jgi:hypothetical protein